jgi:hypothetical protein
MTIIRVVKKLNSFVKCCTTRSIISTCPIQLTVYILLIQSDNPSSLAPDKPIPWTKLQAYARVWLRCSFIWDITHRMLVLSNRRFGTFEDGSYTLYRNGGQQLTTQAALTSQTSKGLAPWGFLTKTVYECTVSFMRSTCPVNIAFVSLPWQHQNDPNGYGPTTFRCAPGQENFLALYVQTNEFGGSFGANRGKAVEAWGWPLNYA